MRLTAVLLDFVSFRRKSIPGNLWGGKQRLIPRVTNKRKALMLRGMLVAQRNLVSLQNPYLSAEKEAPTRDYFKRLEEARDDAVYYAMNAEKFRRRFYDYSTRQHFSMLNANKRWD